ncbi:MAG: hypothetical protein LIP16_05385 [Clostridium sp.]|nr:hypothetical protein [Clostridium sp.]
MSDILIPASSGGVKSDDVTTILAHVLAGETALTSDSGDEPGVGTMTVNSLLSFSCAAYSGRRVLAKWQNPKAAKGKPYSGVYIRCSASGYPGKTGGTQVYKGAGNNTVSEGQSQAYLDLPAVNTTYYLSIYPYVTCSAGEMTGDAINASVKTGAQLNLTFKATQNYTVPQGYAKADVFCVGGGGGGGPLLVNSDGSGSANGGGGGGYTKTGKNLDVKAGQTISIIVGAGGGEAKSGGASSALSISAKGGNPGGGSYGGAGGSGGGAGGWTSKRASSDDSAGGNGGSNGGDGKSNDPTVSGGAGQGTTTRAFGESSGTAYSGGGGGGGGRLAPGTGGVSGGGNGSKSYDGSDGAANTGGGGGGGAFNSNYYGYGGHSGGSGIVLIRLY